MEELKKFKVLYGDYRDPSEFYCEAKNAEQAKTLFRRKYGYNYIKIQRVIEINE
jgi:hypothetical protein